MHNSSTSASLGAITDVHRTDNRRRCLVGATLLAGGLLITPLGLSLSAAYLEDVSGPASPVPGSVLGLGLVLLVLGALRLGQGIIRTGERFTVHERGFVHRVRRSERPVPWSDIVDVEEVEPSRLVGLLGLLGLDYRVRVALRGGGKIRFNSFNANAGLLAVAIKTHAARSR